MRQYDDVAAKIKLKIIFVEQEKGIQTGLCEHQTQQAPSIKRKPNYD